VEQATAIIMATVFLFSGQPDYTKLHPAEVIQLVDDGVTILKELPPHEGEQFTWRALPGQANTAQLVPNQQQVLELGWRVNAPRHYLAQEAPDLYRRIELADREGYSVSLVSAGDGPEPAVQVEVTRKVLVAGTYDAALDVFVGKPTLVKTVCTTSASVKPGWNTVVIWRPPTGPAARGPAPAVANAIAEVPPWAIGKWHIQAGGPALLMEVRANGTVVFSDWPDMAIPAEIGADGGVWLDWVPEGETERLLVVGRLRPDGTGNGAICGVGDGPDDPRWTAARLAPQGGGDPVAPLGQPPTPRLGGFATPEVPAWAVGRWHVEAGEGATEMEVRANSTVVFSDRPETPIPGEITADGAVWLDWEPEGGDERVLVVGRLNPNGTGRGVICHLGKQHASRWGAARLGPQGEAGPVVPPAQSPTLPPAAARRQPEPPGIGILLAAGTPPGGYRLEDLEDRARGTGAEDAQIEISTVWVELTVGSPEWAELELADDKAQFLRQLVDDKRVKVVNQLRLLVPNNQRGEIATAVSLPAVVLPVVPPGAADTPPANRVALTNALCVTPRLLADGSIAMGVETRFENLGGWVTGPRGEVVPIVTHQATNTRLATAEGRTAVMSALSAGSGEVDPDGHPLTQGTQTLILLTPRVIDRSDLPATPEQVAQQGEEEAQLAACRANVKSLCLAANMYAQEHNGTLPAEDWTEQLLPYTKGPDPYVCPAVPELEVGYALNPAVAGLALNDIKRPANLVLFFEVDLVEGRPADDAQAALTAPRHGEKIVVGLVDGHVKTTDFDELQELLQRDPFE